MRPGPAVGAVAIGRNEGERLLLCLRSLAPQVDRLVYVDSGSADGSAERAEALGVEVIRLDPPFTAAKGRAAGFAALERAGPFDLVQFVDGDCEVEAGWVAAAAAALAADPSLGLVTGWRGEVEPRLNPFHALLEMEWKRPAGPIASCGGDMMVRADAYRAAGGFDPALVASEDEEFCLRLAARTGRGLLRLPLPMTRHDARITRLGQWWRRELRAGHGFADLSAHPGHFRRHRLRAWAWGLVLPLVALGALLAGLWAVAAAVAGLYLLSWLRLAWALRREPYPWRQAGLLVLGKLANALGLLRLRLRRLRGVPPRIIEYR